MQPNELAEMLLAACEQQADDISEVFQELLGTPATLGGGEATPLSNGEPPEFAGAGLAAVWNFGTQAAVLMIPEGDLLPAPVAEMEVQSRQKLADFAAGLPAMLLPLEHQPKFAHHVAAPNFAALVKEAKPADDATLIPLTLESGDKFGVLYLLWPVANVAVGKPEEEPSASGNDASADVAPAAEAPAEEIAAGPGEPAARDRASQQPQQPSQPPKFADWEDGLPYLPPHTRSLLKVKVPVVVKLASTKQRVSRILELGHGSIIQFDKSCEETLELEIGDRTIAVGEAVKIGEKFGLRITSMKLPPERFLTVPSRSKLMRTK